MLRRTLLLSAALYPPAAWAAGPWTLVSPEETKRSMAGGPLMIPRAISPPDAPAITVDTPNNPDQPLRAPVTIRLSFKPQAPARISVNTFQALYGFFNIDITSRLLEHAKVDTNGLVAENVNIPAGDHRVTVQITDNQGRVGTRTFKFTVV